VSRLIDVFPSGSCLAPLDVFILAGGLGTRIRPALGEVPKLLAPIAGRPFLDYLLEPLRHFGARHIVLGLGYGASSVIDHLRAQPHPDLVISHVVEPRALGTAGAIRFARAQLRSDPVVVLNGDSLVQADLCEFVAHYRSTRALATILCAAVDHAGRFGRVALNETGYIEAFVEKDPAFDGPGIVSAGIYLLSSQLLDEIAWGPSISLEHDVFESLPPGSLAAFVECTSFVDIGTPESLAFARTMFAPAPTNGN
jgi:NDP-sugar pyrophosphorylase family protein